MKFGLKNNDWLSNLFKDFTPFKIGIFFFLFNVLVDFLLAFFLGSLQMHNGKNGLLNEPMAWSSDFFISPIIISYYFWIQIIPDKIISSLTKEGVITIDAYVQTEVNQAVHLFKNRKIEIGVTILSFIISICFALSIPTSDPKYIGWNSANLFIPWIRGFASIFTFYATIMFIYDMIILIRLLNRIFKKHKVKVHPYHVDKAGGFAVIGKFTSSLAFLFGAFGLHISISLYTNTMPQGIDSIILIYLTKISGFLIFVIFAFSFFFIPIYSGHKAMNRWRESILTEIEKNIDAEISVLQSSFNDTDKMKNALDKINVLHESYSKIEKFSTWPFNLKAIKKYYGIISASSFPGLISIINGFREYVLK